MSVQKKETRRARYQVFGPYRLHKTIGQGEFGKVKLGYHLETNKEVILTQSIKHRYIVDLLEVIETEAYIGMIMEYASGGELFEYILARQNLTEKESARIFAQLLTGVEYLHKRGIVHRDLKLENILLDRNRDIIITDFGFSNLVNTTSDGMLSTSCGSPCYAAPELVINEKYVGELADIWSCGVILYAMLCGTLPFEDDPENEQGEDMVLLYKYIMETKLKFPIPLSEMAKHIVNRILDINPDTRARISDLKRHPFLDGYQYIFDNSEVPELTGDTSEDDLDTRDSVAEKSPLVPGVSSVVNMTTENEELAKSNETPAIAIETVQPEPDTFHRPTIEHKPSNASLKLSRKSLVSLRKNSLMIIDSVNESDELKNTNEQKIEKPAKEVITTSTVEKLGSIESLTESVASTVKSPAQSITNDQPTKQTRFAVKNRTSMQATSTSAKEFLERARKGQSFDVRVADLGSPSVSFDAGGNTDQKLKAHSGPIDQRALTTIDPDDLLQLLLKTLSELGMEHITDDDPYKLTVEVLAQKKGAKKTNLFQDLAQKFRYIRLFGINYNRGFDGTNLSNALANETFLKFDSYVKFNIMIHRINNLKGLYIIDLKRLKGDIWEFKKLYHSLILKLRLNT